MTPITETPQAGLYRMRLVCGERITKFSAARKLELNRIMTDRSSEIAAVPRHEP